MENNFKTQLSDNGTAEQIRAGYLDQSDAIDPETQATERARKKWRADRTRQLNQGMEQAAQYVRGRPLVSVGIAAGVGMILARMLKRR